MKFHEEAFEAAAAITAAVSEEAELDLNRKGAEKAAAFFAVLYERLARTAMGESWEYEEDGEEEEEAEDEESGEDTEEEEAEEEESEGESEEENEASAEEESEEDGEAGETEPAAEDADAEAEAVPAEDEAEEAPAAPISLELFTDARQAYRFRVKSNDGKILASSSAYKDKAACLEAVNALIKGSAGAVLKEI